MALTATQGGRDPDAIHDNVAGEISALTEKASPVNADLVLIEDSAAGNVKKKAQLGNLPGGGGDSTYTDTYANIPAASNDGDLFLPSDGFSAYRDTGAAWVPWGPSFPFTAPVSGDFAWVNQGGASVDTTYGGIYLLGPAGAPLNIRARVKSAPSTPYTITAVILPLMPSINFIMGGLLFRESSSGKFHLWTILHDSATNGWQLQSVKYTDATNWSAVYATLGTRYTGLWFLRIADNATNRICSWSMDGQHFLQAHSVGRTDFLTADQVGFFVQAYNASWPVGMTLLSWVEG
jgi:hypothetical protein